MSYLVEIRGVNFSNKGAELMLCAILDALGGRLTDVGFVLDAAIGSYRDRARYGLLQKIGGRHGGKRGRLLPYFLPEGYRRRYGLAAEAEIDCVLDASGFAYGDAWDPAWIERSAVDLERYRSAGKQVILLPQAFGPFTDERVREASAAVLRSAHLVYARDPESLAHVQELVPGLDSVRLMPDFTQELKGYVPSGFPVNSRRVCVIPNTQMLRHGPVDARDHYVPFLAWCIMQVREKGFDPCLLLHEADRDERFAVALREEAGGAVEMIDESDPLALKGIIGTSAFVIGSRFHALVSALSQGVPALGTSWSHKYRYLFEDYDCIEMLMDVGSDREDALCALEVLTDEARRGELSERLRVKAAGFARQNERMWAEIQRVIQGDSDVAES